MDLLAEFEIYLIEKGYPVNDISMIMDAFQWMNMPKNYIAKTFDSWEDKKAWKESLNDSDREYLLLSKYRLNNIQMPIKVLAHIHMFISEADSRFALQGKRLVEDMRGYGNWTKPQKDRFIKRLENTIVKFIKSLI